MGKKYSLYQVKEMLLSGGYVLDENCVYVNRETKLVFSDANGYFYSSSFGDFLYSLRVEKPINPFSRSNTFKTMNIEKYLLGFGFIFLDAEYKNVYEKMNIVDRQGYKYHISLAGFYTNIKNSGGYPSLGKFNANNAYAMYNVGLWLLENNPLITLIGGKYRSAIARTLEVVCNDCGHIWMAVWNDLHSMKGCSECWAKNRGDHSRNFIDDVISTFNQAGIRLLEPENYKNNKQKLLSECLTCGHIWKTNYASIRRGRLCPNCNSSRGEKIIDDVLSDMGVKFKREKKFPKCKNIDFLRFDFHLPDYDVCVEYQGKQHYRPIDFSGRGYDKAEEVFETQQERDQIKRNFCDNSNIKLIEIPYWDFDNIEEILERELGGY